MDLLWLSTAFFSRALVVSHSSNNEVAIQESERLRRIATASSALSTGTSK